MSWLSRTAKIVSNAIAIEQMQNSSNSPEKKTENTPTPIITSNSDCVNISSETTTCIQSTDESSETDLVVNENLTVTQCFQTDIIAQNANDNQAGNLVMPQDINDMIIFEFLPSELQLTPDLLPHSMQITGSTQVRPEIELNSLNSTHFEEVHTVADSDSIHISQASNEKAYNNEEEKSNSKDKSSDDSYVPEQNDSACSSDEENRNIASTNIQSQAQDNTEIEEDSSNNKGKKKKKNPANWKKNVRMARKAAGDEYSTIGGKISKKKTVGVSCNSKKCIKECTKKITEKDRLAIHSQFWNSSNSENQKRQFIISCIEEVPVQRVRSRNGEREGRRKTSLKYFFSINGRKIPICRTFFLNTLSISQTTVRTALKKRQSSGIIEADQRGKHEPVNKIPGVFRDLIREHIQRFPCVDSHYSRNRSKRKYLGVHLNISRMYSLFLEDCKERSIPEENIPKQWLYSDIFNTEFNLSFSQPSNDTCDLCDEFTVSLKDTTSLEERSKLQHEYDLHLFESQKRYSLKRKDKEESHGKPNIKVVMVDLQKCLPTPVLHNAQSFYSLKLWSFNYTVFDSTFKKSTCFMWDESLGGRGGNEMASCFLRYILDLDNSVEHLVIWSDNCPSQNRNMQMIVCLFYALYLKPSITLIEHKYLLRGHTHMEVDAVHSRLEREQKKWPDFSIMTPWDWQQMARLCSSKSSQLHVTTMELEDFKNFNKMYDKASSPFFQNKKTITKDNFLISKVVCLQVRKESPGILYFKVDFDQEFREVDLNRKSYKKLRNKDLPDLEPIRRTLRPITKKKYDDLQKLLKWVPKRFHGFYKELPFEGSLPEDEEAVN